jgi:hypothetical protein
VKYESCHKTKDHKLYSENTETFMKFVNNFYQILKSILTARFSTKESICLLIIESYCTFFVQSHMQKHEDAFKLRMQIDLIRLNGSAEIKMHFRVINTF